MNIERKWIYLAVAAVFMLIASIPSTFFIKSFKTYFGFLSNWSTGVLRPSKIDSIPPPHVQIQTRVYPPEVKFVKFSIKMPNAKTVRLSADFNRWRPEMLPLKKNRSGRWETVIPLPKGQYNYIFEVDGVFITDPQNPKITEIDKKQVSVIIVQ